ncbi:TonB-dependent receptor [Novosphingobium beihaiensis]|uniref:TonB-dependent receptor n=1 Tax=Novosphingobium beihaiensis TaxID=2930389 RepID=A0ABT0BQX6_9SPHN|nr:TonB-dependent receptor [Novosphingobium beihaiensis]MCJ2187365.1 TonB-dependent receptor [Novosphingobium beihaiensis]
MRAAILASTCIPGAAYAGDVSGTIIDIALERPVRGATVTMDGTAMSAATDEQGRYVFYDVTAGVHTLTVSQPGYRSETLTVTVPETGKVTANGSIALANTFDGNTILVTGARASRLLAIQRKRAMPVVADVVSSDGIGKLPDYNTAEALQRLPGISVEIDQSEPRYVVIRGVDPNLNLVTIDGNVVGIPEAEGRRVALDTIPSDLVGAIEVVKTVTPDYDANAIGGAINIVTPSAYDHSRPFTYVSARGIYGSRADKTGFGASAMHGQTFGSDSQFGIVAGASYSKRFIDSQLVDPLNWEEVGEGLWAPTGIRMFNYSIMRERIGGIVNLEWRPDNDLRVYVNTIYNEFTDHEGRDQFDYDLYRGTAIISGREITYDKGRASREFRQNNQTQKLYNISPGVDWRFGTFELKLNYTYAHAQEHTPVRDDIEFRSAGNKVSTILTGSSMPTFSSIDESLYDPSAFPLRRIRLRREAIDEDLHAIKADLKADFADGTDSFAKVGVKFTDRIKDRDNYQEQWTPDGDVTFADTGAVLDPIAGFFGGKYDFGPAMDYRGVLDYTFVQNPGLLELDEEKTAINDKASDYHINEKIYAGYGMASLDFGAFNVIGGVRVEHTVGQYDAFFLQTTEEGTSIAPLAFKKEYTHVLPSVTVNYRPNQEMVFRAAWTNTIGRPNYSDVVPAFEEEDGDGEAGNPNLKPYTSMGLDLSAEYYPDADTVFALAAFYKHIKNPVYVQKINNTAFAGIELTSLSQPQNADSGNLFGVEANMTARLAFLPAPLDGFGISANVTYVDSSVNVPGRQDDDLPFFRQSKWLAGGALFYEKGPLEARFAVSYRSSYLSGVGSGKDYYENPSNADFDDYTKGRTVLDARIGYRIVEGVEIFGSVSNIGETPLIGYQGRSNRITSREEYGLNADFGISAKF